MSDIIHIASEFSPIAKVGGLGDVLHGLSRKQQERGHAVRVILPKYSHIDFSVCQDLKLEVQQLPVFFDKEHRICQIYTGLFEGVKLVLIAPQSPLRFFTIGEIYGEDDPLRFAFFSMAAMEYIGKLKKQPDIIHCHDWPAALVCPVIEELYRPAGVASRTVLTLHNVAHQGTAPESLLGRFGLVKESIKAALRDPHHHDKINLLAGGIHYANAVVTVSHTYKKELLESDVAYGLKEALIRRERSFFSALNGLDTSFWDPQNDPLLTLPFKKFANFRDAKKGNKRALQEKLGLEIAPDKPLVCAISRLVWQKGPELIAEALEKTVLMGGQFALLGKTFDPQNEALFQKLQQKYSGNPQVCFAFKNDEALAHAVYAGADMIVVPSIFEPCGLSQLIALKYGTIPIVRKTGGLADTVFDLDLSPLPFERRNGFVFDNPSKDELSTTLARAFHTYEKAPDTWSQLVENGLKTDSTWDAAATQYDTIYTSALH